MTKRTLEITAGIVLFALAGLLYIAAGYMPTREGGIPALNTGFYPRILAFILALLSVLMVIETLRKSEGSNTKQTWWMNGHALFMFILTLVLLVLYPFVMKIFGFATASYLFITALIWMLSEKTQRRPVKIALISLGITVLIYVIFKIVLAIPFPQGILL